MKQQILEKSKSADIQTVDGLIFILQGQKVILDSDLARVYGVTTKRLNEQVRRNKVRFPNRFRFPNDYARSFPFKVAICDLKNERGKHRKYLPWAFTEHGAIMAANVLNSAQAVKMSVHVVRAFVRLRESLALHKDLAQKLDELEKKMGEHDIQIQVILDTLRELIRLPEKPKRRIGFTAGEARAH